jgi:hypothetical protein
VSEKSAPTKSKGTKINFDFGAFWQSLAGPAYKYFESNKDSHGESQQSRRLSYKADASQYRRLRQIHRMRAGVRIARTAELALGTESQVSIGAAFFLLSTMQLCIGTIRATVTLTTRGWMGSRLIGFYLLALE